MAKPKKIYYGAFGEKIKEGRKKVENQKIFRIPRGRPAKDPAARQRQLKRGLIPPNFERMVEEFNNRFNKFMLQHAKFMSPAWRAVAESKYGESNLSPEMLLLGQTVRAYRLLKKSYKEIKAIKDWEQHAESLEEPINLKMGIVAGELIKNFFINKNDETGLILAENFFKDNHNKLMTTAQQLEEKEIELDWSFETKSVEENFFGLFKFNVMDARNFLKINWDYAKAEDAKYFKSEKTFEDYEWIVKSFDHEMDLKKAQPMTEAQIEFYKESWKKTVHKIRNIYWYKRNKEQKKEYQQQLLEKNPEYAEANRERSRNLKFTDPEKYAQKLIRDRERLREKRAQKKAEKLAKKAASGII